MRDKPYRSLLKTISWRTTGTIDTFLVSWLITGKVSLALTIGGVEIFTKLVLYYLHERAWDRVKFGRKPLSGDVIDYQI